MALVLADRVQETTTTSGTGTLTLAGAVAGYRTFSSGIGNGNTTYYCIYDQTAQVWEIGLGTVGAGTLTRTTVYSNSSGTTSPLTLAGNTTSVFAVYTATKTVNLDASGNVTALGNVTSGTWQGSTVGVAYGGTGVTSSSGASSVVLRDSNANVIFNNFTANATNVTAAAGTTVLTVASARTQILTGSTTQTFQLPDATTLTLGQSFLFINLSSGILTVKDNASTTIDTIPGGAIVQLGALSIATSAGSWGAYSFLPSSYDFNNSTADFGGANVTNATWKGTPVAYNYGGTGLSTFTAANYALYSTSASALTAGTLPVPAGGTGQTSFTAGYIPYGNTSAALQSSASLQFNGTYLVVGGTTPLGGATNPITAFSASANNYVQTYVYNATNGTSSSADFVAYSNNSTDTHGFADLGYNSSTYADATYTCTGPNEAYLFGSAPANVSATGNLVYATDSTGTANAHQWYVGGFTQAKGAWKMQLTSTGLQLANALATTYGGTGLTSFTSGGAVYATSTSALTTGTLPITAGGTGLSAFATGDLIIGSGTNTASRLSIGTNGYVLTSNGTTASWTAPSGATTMSRTDFTATAGQTTFTISYTPGLIDVYRNGVKLANADYTATNGTSVVLATGANVGDVVECVVYTALATSSAVNSISFGSTGLTPSTASTGNVTVAGTLGIANGGTGQTSFTAGQIHYGSFSTSSALSFDGASLSVNGVSVGRGAGAVSTNTAVGNAALAGTNSGVGHNTAVGYQALLTNTTGTNLDAFGAYVLNKNTTGTVNTGMGGSNTIPALYNNTTGSYNVGLGVGALFSNTTASNNTAVGYQAGYAATGAENTYCGYLAGGAVTTGANNVLIGARAGQYQNAITTGSNNIVVSYAGGLASATDSNEIFINTVYNASGKGSNTGYINPNGGGVYQGNNSSSWSTTSDQRLKKNIVDNNDGLDKITAITVRNFEYRLPEEITELAQTCAIQKEGVQLGVIAQELQAVLPECVKQESTGVLSVDTDNLTWYLINAVKQLKAEIDLLKGAK
jgi:hypothetical protein